WPLSCPPALRQRDPQQTAVIAGVDVLGIHWRGQRYLQSKRTLSDADGMVGAGLLGGRELTAALDDHHVFEKLNFEVVLVDAGKVDDDLDRGRSLEGVGVGPPAGMDEKAQALALPELADQRPRRLAGVHHHRVAVAQSSIAHRVRWDVGS